MKTAVFYGKCNKESIAIMNELVFRPATPEDAAPVFSLYRSLVGTPYCAWDETYPSNAHVSEDIAAKALYCLHDGTELAAAATIRLCEEHNAFPCWSAMKNPCDLMRIGVSRNRQGRGTGRFFLMKLLEEAKRTGYDGMRILVAKTNLPAVSLYRRIGARYCGDVFSYNIDWFCYELKF